MTTKPKKVDLKPVGYVNTPASLEELGKILKNYPNDPHLQVVALQVYNLFVTHYDLYEKPKEDAK